MNIAIKVAYEKVRQAERDRAAVIRKTYAIGDIVSYKHGKFYRSVKVIDHSSDDRILVQGPFSGRKYWIGAYRVV